MTGTRRGVFNFVCTCSGTWSKHLEGENERSKGDLLEVVSVMLVASMYALSVQKPALESVGENGGSSACGGTSANRLQDQQQNSRNIHENTQREEPVKGLCRDHQRETLTVTKRSAPKRVSVVLGGEGRGRSALGAQPWGSTHRRWPWRR